MKKFGLILIIIKVLCSEGGKIGDLTAESEFISLSTEPFDVPPINITGREGRIVLGTTAWTGQFPHFALIFVRRASVTVQCGAGLISTSWALTADHCVREAISIEVRCGITHRDKFEQRVYVSGTARKTEVDIALIKLATKVQVTSLVKPAFLPRSIERNALYANKMATISGMGIENTKTNQVSNYLKYTELKIMAQADCRPYFGDVDIRRLCAKSTSSNAATCPGDSGSPLIMKDVNDVVIVGVVSFGSAYGCDIGYPTGYTRTTHQLDWIVSFTGIKLRT